MNNKRCVCTARGQTLCVLLTPQSPGPTQGPLANYGPVSQRTTPWSPQNTVTSAASLAPQNHPEGRAPMDSCPALLSYPHARPAPHHTSHGQMHSSHAPGLPAEPSPKQMLYKSNPEWKCPKDCPRGRAPAESQLRSGGNMQQGGPQSGATGPPGAGPGRPHGRSRSWVLVFQSSPNLLWGPVA